MMTTPTGPPAAACAFSRMPRRSTPPTVERVRPLATATDQGRQRGVDPWKEPTMNKPYTHVVRTAEIDPVTGQEDPRHGAFGVAAGHEDGYAVTRSADTLDELRGLVGNLADERALWEHARLHHPSL